MAVRKIAKKSLFVRIGTLGLFFLILFSAAVYSGEVDHQEARERLIRNLRGYWELDDQVLDLMEQVPRHRFVPEDYRELAYIDRPLPVGYGQTISAPHMVAQMLGLLKLDEGSRVLEAGTGTGYTTALMAEVVEQVYTLETTAPLLKQAEDTLDDLGYSNVEFRMGDGYLGWREEAPFDAILVMGSTEELPEKLVEQLSEGGRMVIPIGPPDEVQTLYLVTKEDGEMVKKDYGQVRFGPLIRDFEDVI